MTEENKTLYGYAYLKTFEDPETGEKFLYPSDPHDGQCWSPAELEMLIEQLQNSLNNIDLGTIAIVNEKIRNPEPYTMTDEDYIEYMRPVKRKKMIASIYLMRSENGKFKIGRSIDVENRFRQIQNSIPFKLEMIHHFLSADATRVEKAIQKHLGEYWVKGEWFELPDHAVEWFCQFQDEVKL